LVNKSGVIEHDARYVRHSDEWTNIERD